MVNHAQDLMSVKIFFVLPNKLIPTIGYLKATVVHIRVTLGHLRVTIDH